MSKNPDVERISLANYLANRGLSSQSPEVCTLLARIHRGEQEALLRLTITSAPYHRLPEHLREVLTTYTFKDVPAMSDGKTAGEIAKAARGMQADWKYLDVIELVLSYEVSNEQNSSKRITAQAAHVAKIVHSLKKNNYDPLSLPPKEKGRSVARKVVQQALVASGKSGGLSLGQFKNAWDQAINVGELKYAPDGSKPSSAS